MKEGRRPTNAVPTSQKTHCIFITNRFVGIKQHITRRCVGKMQNWLVLKGVVVHRVTTVLYMVDLGTAM